MEHKETLSLAVVDCMAYSGHSFCIRAATVAAAQGISDTTIKMLGRWQGRSTSKHPGNSWLPTPVVWGDTLPHGSDITSNMYLVVSELLIIMYT